MSLLQNSNAIPVTASADFYDHQIANSVRLYRGGANSGSKLTRTPGSTGTSRRIYTLSTWIKRGGSGELGQLMTAQESSSTNYVDELVLRPSGENEALAFYGKGGNAGGASLKTNASLRDHSAWYHIMVAVDTTQGTDTNRVKIYLNGELQTLASTTYPAQNYDGGWGNNREMAIGWGTGANNGYPYDGLMAETIYIDGTAQAVTDLGESKNGVWIPKDPSELTFGDNGFWLKYESSSDLGNDSSGNNNDLTVSGLSAHDQMLDSPTFNSDSNGGNFCTLSGIAKHSTVTLSEGNLRSDCSNASIVANVESSYGFTSGKIYFEMTNNTGSNGSYPVMTVTDASNYNFSNTAYYGYGVNRGGDYIINASNTANVGSLNCSSTGDIRMFAIDFDNSKLWAGKNGTWYNTSGTSYTNSTGPESGNNYIVNGWDYDVAKLFTGHNDSSCGVNFNFGQDGTFSGNKTAQGNSDATGYGNFYYTVPDGFLAVCSGNQPVADEIDPAQTDDNYPQKLFGVLKYSGNGSERTIDTTFQIDMAWARSTIQGQNWYALDTTRGFFGASSNNKYMKLDTDGVEATFPQYNFKAQSGSDITITSGTWLNSSGHTQQMWNFRLNGGTTAANSNGSLASVTQVDPSGCICVGTYTANATNSTIGHGLSKKPALIILKKRDNQDRNWTAWHHSLSNTQGYLSFFENSAASTDSQIWQNTAPTSTVFSVNYGTTETNAASGDKFLFYAFADCEGYIKIGKYIGNADANGPFIYTGFKPAFLMTRPVDSGDDPLVWDIVQSEVNPMQKTLSTHNNSAQVDNSNRSIDFLSNGFKIRTSNSNANTSDADGILFMAFAENPFKYATAK